MRSWAPEPQQDGLRRYGEWVGNPGGAIEDATRCICSVSGGWRTKQCKKPRGKGPGGLYCGTHNPEAIAEREDKARAKRQTEYDQRAKVWRLQSAAPALLEAAIRAEKLLRNGGIVPIKGETWAALVKAIAEANGEPEKPPLNLS